VTDARAVSSRRLGLSALPLIVFLALGGLLLARLGAGDASRLPSALIGQPAPKLELGGLDGGPGLTGADLKTGHVRLVNIFASWCQPCHIEHEYLMALAGDSDLKAKGVEILGVAQKDSAENIRRFLGAAGDPYAKVGLDPDNRAGIDWGVYGVPETFVVRGDGVIAYKFVGPMDPASIEKTLKPEILKAAQQG
jgi:cytochrome c biogenesis protein CcmG, thiol:disulfide interchange protein DsbE